ncbi:MAG: SprT-like domain-containing protein [Pirellulaceae bacterium]
MTRQFELNVRNQQVPPHDVQQRTRSVYQQVLQKSRYLDGGNFSVIHPDDLRLLFDAYDEIFFDGGCRQSLGDSPLQFRLSKRMTKTGGTTTRRQFRQTPHAPLRCEYEIAVSTTLLFHSFGDDHRSIRMSGIACRDRLEALQRVIEHEMVHLIEMLLWTESSCAAPRFQSIAQRHFGHTEHRHQLITPREKAFTQFGIRTGDRVAFRIDNQQLVGMVNRITKRATVLVEDGTGEKYSDGKRYTKYYVPVHMLHKLKV